MKVLYSSIVGFLVVFHLLLTVDASAQASSSYTPNVLPPSPNAAALMKFTDVPVSPYTGTAQVTVPIYTIQARGLSIPIELDYHTGGIKLKEEASSVGLGWALSAGGSISRTIRDKDDFNTDYPYFTNQVPQLAGDLSSVQYLQAYFPYQSTELRPNFGLNMFDMSCTDLVNTSGGVEDFYQAFALEGGNAHAAYDMEPDIYNYDFAGHSGKFILTRAGGVVLQKQDNIQITFERNGNSFTILDEKGNKYYFAAKEIMESATGLPSSNAISSWNISTIVTNQNDSISFTYNSDNTYTQTQPDITETYSFNCNPSDPYNKGNSAPYLYFNLWLQSISFSSGQLQFVFDGSRSDLQGGKKLDAVKLYGQSKSGLTYINEHDLFYSYFVPNYYQTGGADSLIQLRLRLDSVKEISGNLSVPPYSFSYFLPTASNSNSLAKNAFNVDHWGYYNGVSNTTFLPSETVMDEPPGGDPQTEAGYDLITYTGANRNPDNSSSAQSMETFALNSIRYPTGGKTVFSYEPNDYDDSASTVVGTNGTGVSFPQLQTVQQHVFIPVSTHGTTSGSVTIKNIFPTIPNGEPGTNLTLDVFFRGSGNDSVDYHTLQGGDITFSLTGPGINLRDDITDSYCSGSGNTCTENTMLTINTGDSVTLNYTGYIAPVVNFTYFTEIDVNIFYNVLQSENTAPTSSYGGFVAGGLRIGTVTDYSSDTVIADQRKYTYGYQRSNQGVAQNYSYGKLMSRPSYLRYAPGYIAATDNGAVVTEYCTDMIEYANSLTPLTSVIQSNIVGYDQVAEMKIDPVTGQDIGKTVYTYFNSPDTGTNYAGFSFPGTFNMGNNLNGSLLSKTTYADVNGNYQPVESTTNYYHTTNRSVYFSPEYQYLGGAVTTTFCNSDTSTPYEVFSCFYPSVKSERVLLDATSEVTYDQVNPAQYVQQMNYYYYDNPVHYLLTRSGTVDSKGNSIVQRMRYPQDYIPSGQTVTGNAILDSMIGRNMVSPVIEKQDSFYYSGSSTGYITGAQLSPYRILSSNQNTIMPDKAYKLDVQSPITNFQPFSISGNTTNMDSRNQQMTSFDQYDLKNNLQQYTPTNAGPVSIIWDYSNKYPIAQAKNAVITDVAATSFEADGYGNWNAYTGVITTASSAPFPPTGHSYYNLTTSATLTKSGLVSGRSYVISYWSMNGAYSITGGTGTVVTGKVINGWTYYEHSITASSTTLTISGTGAIDEVRLYPSTAQMTTYTYSPLVGMTTSCDEENKVTYYYYDSLGRLKWEMDQDGNIIKTYQYHYQSQPGNQY